MQSKRNDGKTNKETSKSHRDVKFKAASNSKFPFYGNRRSKSGDFLIPRTQSEPNLFHASNSDSDLDRSSRHYPAPVFHLEEGSDEDKGDEVKKQDFKQS